MDTKDFTKWAPILLADGKWQEIRRAFRRLNFKRLSRKSALEIAEIARRTGRPDLTLRLLGPIVRPSKGQRRDPSDKEVATYAAALLKIGAVEEGYTLLQSIKKNRSTEFLLFSGHALMSQWDYSKAIPLFTELVNSPLSEEMLIIGTLNLAACLVYEKKSELANKALNWLSSETKRRSLKIFLSNVLELQAQLAIGQLDFETANYYLAEGETTFQDESSIESFFIRKWKMILELRKNGFDKKTAALWETTRTNAQSLRHWESVRDCDFIKAIVTGDTNLLIHLYYGTPFESFRRRLFLESKEQWTVPDYYVLKLVGRETTQSKVTTLDLTTPKIDGVTHRLLEAMVSDFYRPRSIGFLFSALHRGEYFNSQSSPMRIYQSIKRLRQQVLTQVGLHLEPTPEGYHLFSMSQCQILLPHRFHEARKKNESFLFTFGDHPFTTRDIMKTLDLSKGQALRLIQKELGEGNITQVGRGPNTLYELVKSEAEDPKE